MTDRNDDKNWHLDKKVPLALIAVLLGQTFCFGYWGANLSGRVDNIERAQAQMQPQADRLTRVEVGLDNIKETLAEIKTLIRRNPPN